jgi:hypothetical protein
MPIGASRGSLESNEQGTVERHPATLTVRWPRVRSTACYKTFTRERGMRAYQEMMYGAEKHDPAARTGWRNVLEQCCPLDKLSMVLILEHWRPERRR